MGVALTSSGHRCHTRLPRPCHARPLLRLCHEGILYFVLYTTLPRGHFRAQDSADLTVVSLMARHNVARATGGNRVWSLKQPVGLLLVE